MAQGSRGRVALLGAGVLFCTGLVGCQDTKQYPPPPLAKGNTPSMNGMTRTPGTTTGTGMTPGGSGLATTSWNSQPASRTTPAAYDYNSTAPGYGNTGTISGPAKTGVIGPGGPMPAGASSYVPPVGPSFPSNYTPTNPSSSLTPGSPTSGYMTDTTARGAAPAAALPVSIHSPEPPAMADPYPTPPPAPSTSAVPPVTAASGGLIAPPSPPAGSAPLAPQYQPIK